MHGLFGSGHFVYLIPQAAHIQQNKVPKPIRQCGNVFASSLEVFNVARSITCSLNILHPFLFLLLNSPLSVDSVEESYQQHKCTLLLK